MNQPPWKAKLFTISQDDIGRDRSVAQLNDWMAQTPIARDASGRMLIEQLVVSGCRQATLLILYLPAGEAPSKVPPPSSIHTVKRV